jgi:hypothetical protein
VGVLGLGASRKVTLTLTLSSVEGWQLSRALQGRLRTNGAIVELTFDRNSFAGNSPDSNDVSAGR